MLQKIIAEKNKKTLAKNAQKEKGIRTQ